jgi:predicted dehydrogenase
MDTSKGADFSNIEDAIRVHSKFDTVNICTPNFTHINLARAVAPYAGIVFVEKPGVVNSEAWRWLCADYPTTRFMMVKNNQYRDLKQFKLLADQSHTVRIVWNNKNRIPNPGSWFTTKDKAFGGVSRDLMPHMLSYYVALTDYTKGNKLYSNAIQRHELKNLIDTDYGRVNHNGTYDVDDFCEFEFKNGNTTWVLTANWKDDKADDVYISFDMKNSAAKFVLGLCPESAYKAMIKNAVDNLNNSDFWTEQLAQDLWIHKQIENL